MKERKGFTLVELLAVIVILGILSIGAIKGVATLIEKSRTEQKVHQEKVMKMAAESYLQANKSKMPKAIGETVKIEVNELKTSNYLKEELKNSKGETCMENSYVKVYKASKNDYEYDAQLFCGTDPVTEDNTDVKKPVVVPLFTDSSGNKNDDVYKNVSDAYLKITIKGSDDEKVAVDGYTYTIYAKRKGEDNLNEVYNSGTLSGNGKESVVVPPIPLKNYIDITNVTEFKVKVVAINALGGRSEEIIGSGSDSGDSATYHDTNPPKCKEIKGAAEEGQWINKANMTSATSTNKSRTISAVCEDGTGSGCIRQEFRRTWPNTEQQDAEFSYIQVQDNAGNVSVKDNFAFVSSTCGVTQDQRKNSVFDNNCRVRVNVDITAPTAKISAYKAGANLTKANNTNIFKDAETIANNAKQEVTINSNEYQNLYGGWMNKENYPNGVVYEVAVSDNIHLKSWTWETNAAYVTDRQLDSYDKAYSSSNPDGKATTTFQQKDMTKNDCGTLSETIKFGFTQEGMRKGKLTILDEAGNPTIFYIEANIDRTAPPVPEPTKLTIAGGGTYTPAVWINKHITASVADSFKRDNLSNGGKTTLAGFMEFRYETIKPGGTKVKGSSQTFLFNDNYQGKNSITFVGCDKANNCSNKNTSKQVWLDTVAPLCTVTLSNPGVNSKGWQGKGEKSTVKAE